MEKTQEETLQDVISILNDILESGEISAEDFAYACKYGAKKQNPHDLETSTLRERDSWDRTMFVLEREFRAAGIVRNPELTDEERQKCEIWTRVMGYLRPVSGFNQGKKSEFQERKYFSEDKAV